MIISPKFIITLAETFIRINNTDQRYMGQKRIKDQIFAQILKTCDGEGASKTKVVYTSGLNFYTIKAYLATLDKNNLIEIVPGPRPLYRTTQRGKDALVHFMAIEELLCAN